MYMHMSGKAIAAGLLAMMMTATMAEALPATSSAGAFAAIGGSSSGDASKITFGDSVATPLGYYQMCVSHQSLCRLSSGRLSATADGSVKVNGATMRQLESVNASVNAAIRPAIRNDWTPGQTVGDCKAFAMTKRQRLINMGWPSSAVPVAIVRTSSGVQHLVVVARTNQGDFVLDSLNHSIVPWTSAAYSWEKILSTTNGLAWRTM